MKGIPISRGLLVITLTITMIFAVGMLEQGTSYANAGNHYAYVIGYSDGQVRPLDPLTREEAAVIFYRLMNQEDRKEYDATISPFNDVNGSRWSNNEIAVLARAKIIHGYGDGSFKPSKPITRAEFASIAAKYAVIAGKSDPLDDDAENKFPDMEGHWGNKFINDSIENGWIRGYGDGTFRPDNLIIRCEAMMLINNALDRRVNFAGLHEDAIQWKDNLPDNWYYEIVLEATNTHEYERGDKPKSTEIWIKIINNPVL